MNTSRDYADMVNPHVRAEQEAFNRGWRQGALEAWFCAALIAAVVVAVVWS